MFMESISGAVAPLPPTISAESKGNMSTEKHRAIA